MLILYRKMNLFRQLKSGKTKCSNTGSKENVLKLSCFPKCLNFEFFFSEISKYSGNVNLIFLPLLSF